MNGSIQALRAVFILMIFLSHFPFGESVDMSFMGDCGVSMFMMLSGYTMMLAYGGRASTAGGIEWIPFMRRRLARIYPVHLLCFSVCSIWGGGLLAAVAGLLLLQSWVPDAGVFFSYNAPSWFLSSLLLCYALFPALSRVAVSRPKEFGFLLLGIISVYLPVAALLPEEFDLFGLYVWPPARLIDFMIGMWLYVAGPRLDSAWWRAGAVALFGAACVLWFYSPEWLRLASLWYVPSAAVIAAFAGAGKGGYNGATGAWAPAALVWLGNSSYGFYMIHYFCIGVWRRVAGRFGMDAGSFIGLLLTLSVAVMLGYMIEKWPRTFRPSGNNA